MWHTGNGSYLDFSVVPQEYPYNRNWETKCHPELTLPLPVYLCGVIIASLHL